MAEVKTQTRNAPNTTAPARSVEQVAAPPTRRWLAVTRIALGFIFLWAFLDKTFGLGYSTSAAKSWLNGGSPTSGFLGHVEVGPLRGLFSALAGSGVVDWLFMIGLLGIGVALIAGIGLLLARDRRHRDDVGDVGCRVAVGQDDFDGQPSSSVNPIVHYHLIYALVLIVVALGAAVRTWGLGQLWESTSRVGRAPWLR